MAKKLSNKEIASHSSIRDDIYEHVAVLSELSNILRKLSCCGIQKFLAITGVYPLCEILGAINTFRDIVHLIYRKIKGKS